MSTSRVTDENQAASPQTARVIPFPARAGAQTDEPQARLAQALNSLESALASQRAAVAAWRNVLKDLKSSTATLDASLQRYRATLTSLGSSVSALHGRARALEEWADNASHTKN